MQKQKQLKGDNKMSGELGAAHEKFGNVDVAKMVVRFSKTVSWGHDHPETPDVLSRWRRRRFEKQV